MAESVRRLKINRRYASSVCAWCGELLELGEDGAVCEACEAPHHARCWNNENGCAQADCINAPLRQGAELAPELAPLSGNEMRCPHCQAVLSAGAITCSSCRRFTTASGLYEGQRKTASEVSEAFLLGLASLVVPLLIGWVMASMNVGRCGFLPVIIGMQCGWNAMSKASKAKMEIANDQTLKGRGLAIAAQILGTIGVVLPILSFIVGMFLLFGG